MNRILPLLALSLLSPLSLAAASGQAPALEILKRTGTLCYSTLVAVNGKEDDDLIKSSSAQLASRLHDLGLDAQPFSQDCDREVIFSFEVDVDGAPSVYTDNLRVVTYAATDVLTHVDLDSAVVWREGYWGGAAGVYSREEYSKRINDQLEKLFNKLKIDYLSLK